MEKVPDMVGKHWNRLPGVAVEFPSVEVLKIQQNLVLDNLLCGPCSSVRGC